MPCQHLRVSLQFIYKLISSGRKCIVIILEFRTKATQHFPHLKIFFELHLLSFNMNEINYKLK